MEMRGFVDSSGNELRGMAALESLQSDEPILSVPAKQALVVTSGGPCPDEDLITSASWQRLPWWAQLAVLLLNEKKVQPPTALAAWIASLPQEFPTVPLAWTQQELDSLEYPALASAVAQQRSELRNAYAEIVKGCSVEFSEEEFQWAVMAVRSRAFSGPYE
eukprot:5460660-Amphidinium_carterae.1